MTTDFVPARTFDMAMELLKKARAYAVKTAVFEGGEIRRMALEDLQEIDIFIRRQDAAEIEENREYSTLIYNAEVDAWNRGNGFKPGEDTSQ
jgi:hypothetical protein